MLKQWKNGTCGVVNDEIVKRYVVTLN